MNERALIQRLRDALQRADKSSGYPNNKQHIQAADDLAAENKLLKDSVVKDSLTVQITDSAKIRAAFEDDDFHGVPV